MGNTNSGTPIPKVHLPSPSVPDFHNHVNHLNHQYSTPLSSTDYLQRKKRYSEIKTKSVCSICSSENTHRTSKTFEGNEENDEHGNIFHEIRTRFRFRKLRSARGILKTESQDFSSDIIQINSKSIHSSTPLRQQTCHSEYLGNLSRSAININPNNDLNPLLCDNLSYLKPNRSKKSSIKKIFQSNFYGNNRSDINLNSFKSFSLTDSIIADKNTEILNILSTPKKRCGNSNSKPILEKITEASSNSIFTSLRGRHKKRTTKKTVSYEDANLSAINFEDSLGNLRKSISCNTLKNPEQGTLSKKPDGQSNIEKPRRAHLKKSKTASPQEIFEKNMSHLSTSEVLKSLANYIRICCPSLFPKELQNYSSGNSSIKCRQENIFHPMIIASWIRGIDRSLLIQGWSEIPFISPVNITFLYMLLKNYMKESIIKNHSILHSMIISCLYLSYSYMGNEISYPLKPFITAEMKFNQSGQSRLERRNERSQSASISPTASANCFSTSVNSYTNNSSLSTFNTSFDSRQSFRENLHIDIERDRFWLKCLTIMNEQSSYMLKINADIDYFMSLFFELCQYGSVIKESIIIQPKYSPCDIASSSSSPHSPRGKNSSHQNYCSATLTSTRSSHNSNKRGSFKYHNEN